MSLAPLLTTVTEYDPISVSYTVTPPPPPDPLPDPPIVPEILTVTLTPHPLGVTVVMNSLLSFTVGGLLEDVFNRTMTYLDKDEKVGSVTRFQDIPTGFKTLYQYRGATVNSIDIIISVTTSWGTGYTAELIVKNSWEKANANLHKYVALGEY